MKLRSGGGRTDRRGGGGVSAASLTQTEKTMTKQWKVISSADGGDVVPAERVLSWAIFDRVTPKAWAVKYAKQNEDPETTETLWAVPA
jgi:hypothetical protein